MPVEDRRSTGLQMSKSLTVIRFKALDNSISNSREALW